MTTALVTGGAGFIGSNLVDALVARGDRVAVIDDLSTGRRSNIAGALESGIEFIEADVRDRDAVRTAISAAEPRVVYHLGAQIDVRKSVADPRFDLDLNGGGTLELLEASREAGVERFVFASTAGAIYGEGEGRSLPFDEDAECVPDAPYGQSKFAAEGYVGLYARLHGLATVSLRLANVYGPRQDPLGEAGVVAIFSGALLDGRATTVFGDGRQTRDYIYVGDVVDGFLAAGVAEATGRFNISTGIETSVLDLGAAVATACGREFEPEFAPARLGEVARTAADPGRAGRELGWAPATTLAEGLASTVDWARSTAAARSTG
jgi:UDP-glucose 4-epimerase